MAAMSCLNTGARVLLAAVVIATSATTAPAQQQGQAQPPGSFQRVPMLPFPAVAQEFELSGTRYRVVPVVAGLANPWSITFLPGGGIDDQALVGLAASKCVSEAHVGKAAREPQVATAPVSETRVHLLKTIASL